MSILELVQNIKGYYIFWCPGCERIHGIHTVENANGDSNPVWSFNGDMDKPTFSPSLLCRYTYGPNKEKRVCHSFIRDGVWEYLNDCTHKFAGQKVPMRDLDNKHDDS